MAKKSRDVNPNTTRFSIQSYNTAHFRTTEAYAAMIDVLFDRATDAITKAAARGEYDPDKPFSFDDYPDLKKKMQETLVQLTSRMTTVIETGTKQEWLFAVRKNDDFLASIIDTSKLTKGQLAQLQDRNLDGLKAFQQRKGKMGLSKEVWKIGEQYQNNIQDALDVGLGDGRSAQALARDVKQNLKNPDKLFRRVRDKHGNLRLSKAAAAYHPGQGVYRSAVKNAQRLTRTEINMAYRESDYQRWQQLDFVVGFEVFRSNHDPLCKCKVCEKLVGRYPKNFKFVGWHPQCMCYAVPILMDEETFDENELGDLKAALRGTEYKKKQAKNLVTTLPDGFNEWAAQNAEKQKGWKSTPYFIRDNFKNGSLADGLNDNIFQLQSAIESDVASKINAIRAWGELSKEEQKKYTDLRKSNLYELPEDLRDACDEYGISYAKYDELYWDLYDATKPKTDMLGNVIDYPDYHKWNEAIQERQSIEQTLAAKIQDAKVKARQVIEDFKRRFEDARIWLKLDVAVIQSVEDSWNIIVSDKYPVFTSVFNSLSLKTDYTARIDSVRKELDKAQKDAQALITKGQGDLSELKRLIALSPSVACPAETIVEQLKTAINGLNVGNVIGVVSPEMKSVLECTTHDELKKKMIDGGFATSVSVDAMSVEHARIFCAEVVGYVQKFNLKPIEVNCKAFGRGNTNTFAWANGSHVDFNKRYFSKSGAKKKITESFANCTGGWKKTTETDLAKWKGWLDDYEKDIKKWKTELLTETNPMVVDYLKRSIKSYKKAKADLQKYYDKQKAFIEAGHTRHNVFLSEETFVRDLARHELGHTFHDQILGRFNGSKYMQSRIDVSVASKLKTEWIAIYNKHKGNCSWLSAYGTKDDGEFFSECMVLYMSGGKGLPKDVKAWIDKFVVFARK